MTTPDDSISPPDLESDEEPSPEASPSASAEVDITPLQDGGVLKTLLTPSSDPSAPTVPIGAHAEVHYTGSLFRNGKEFDSSRGKSPLEVDVGSGGVIRGFDLAIQSMKKGEQSRFTLLPEYAYGENGSGSAIGPNETLVFELEIVDWTQFDFSSLEEQLAAAEEFKVTATAHLREGRARAAQESYLKAKRVLMGCDKWEDRSKALVGLLLMAKCLLNAALMAVRLNEPQDAVGIVGDGLRTMQNRGRKSQSKRTREETGLLVKMYFCRATAHKAMNQFDEALVDLRHCLRLQPSNRAVKREKTAILKKRRTLRM